MAADWKSEEREKKFFPASGTGSCWAINSESAVLEGLHAPWSKAALAVVPPYGSGKWHFALSPKELQCLPEFTCISFSLQFLLLSNNLETFRSEIFRVILSLQLYWGMKLKGKVVQSCPTLCDPMDCIVHGILQVRILEWVAFPFSRAYFQPWGWTQVSHTAGGFFTDWTREAQEYWSG